MTLHSVYRWLVGGLAEAGSEEAPVEADLLLEAATGWGPLVRLTDPERAVTPEAQALLTDWLEARRRRVPIQHLVGHADFWGLRLRVSPSVLIPRPDTETLVAEALTLLSAHPEIRTVVDMGTGSGAIALAIKKACPQLRVLAIDKSEAALAVARENGERLGISVEWVLGDGWEAVEKSVDWPHALLVSNPPYIASRELAQLQPEVQFDPLMALDGGLDGLDFYRRLKRAPAQWLAVEVGEGQAPQVAKMWQDNGWQIARVSTDLGGIERVVVASR